MKRVRLAAVVVQFEAYADDGENLEPVQVQPIRTSVADFKTLDLEEITKTLQAQFDEQDNTPEDTGFQ